DQVLDDLHVVVGRAHDDRVRPDLGGDADHFVRQGPAGRAAPPAAAFSALSPPATAAEHPPDVGHGVLLTGLRLHGLFLEDVVERLGGFGGVRIPQREDLDLELGGGADVDDLQDAGGAVDAFGAARE